MHHNRFVQTLSACRVLLNLHSPALASCYKTPTAGRLIQFVKRIFVTLLHNPKFEAFLLYFTSTVPSLSFSLTEKLSFLSWRLLTERVSFIFFK